MLNPCYFPIIYSRSPCGTYRLGTIRELELFQLLTLLAFAVLSLAMNAPGHQFDGLNERLAHSGLRSTPHRQHVYEVLLAHPDHPTAEEVFIRMKKDVPEIAMATVYNSLDALVKCGLVRLVNVDRGATRFCPNMKEHGHFVCESCGAVFDIEIGTRADRKEIQVPSGFKIDHYDIAIHGQCARCTSKA
jgi:Fe2+ or Zn2+ uptake regulation protein